MLLLWALLACRTAPEATTPTPKPSDTGALEVVDSAGTAATADTGAASETSDTGALAPATGATADTGDACAWSTTPVTTSRFIPWAYNETMDLTADGWAISNSSGFTYGHNPYGDFVELTEFPDGYGYEGLRVLPSGEVVVANNLRDQLLIADYGSQDPSVLARGLASPLGLEVDAGGQIYVGNHDAGEIVRVNSADGSDTEVIATGLPGPRALVFSPDGQILYAGMSSSVAVWSLTQDASGAWGAPVQLFDGSGTTGVQALQVDSCGNLYATLMDSGIILRISSDGLRDEVLVDTGAAELGDLRWGVDGYGWDKDTLYVVEPRRGRVLAVDVGMEGVPHL